MVVEVRPKRKVSPFNAPRGAGNAHVTKTWRSDEENMDGEHVDKGLGPGEESKGSRLLSLS